MQENMNILLITGFLGLEINSIKEESILLGIWQWQTPILFKLN